MSSSLSIITGASRGLGLEIAKQLCKPGATIVGLSRGASDELTQYARQSSTRLLQWQVDLTQPCVAAAKLEHWFKQEDADGYSSVTLINNAGMLGQLAPLEEISAELITSTLVVGLEAPLQLTRSFIRSVRDWSMPKKVLNISSGMGRRAQAGSILYCAAKAGMDHFTRCVALDEERRTNGVRMTSLAPGVIDTDMQKELRASDPNLFPDRERYIQFKQNSVLKSAEDVAENILFHLNSEEFGVEPVTNLIEMKGLPK